jgi:hypothetical protein
MSSISFVPLPNIPRPFQALSRESVFRTLSQHQKATQVGLSFIGLLSLYFGIRKPSIIATSMGVLSLGVSYKLPKIINAFFTSNDLDAVTESLKRSDVLIRDFGSGKPSSGLYQEAIKKGTSRAVSISNIRLLTGPDYEPVTLRSFDGEKAYQLHKKNLAEAGIKPFEFISRQISSGSPWLIMPNPFPYEMKAGFKHYVIWFKKQNVDAGIEEKVALIVDRFFNGKKTVFYCQDEVHRSIPEIVHWHVLVQRDLDISKASPSLQIRALLTDTFIA